MVDHSRPGRVEMMRRGRRPAAGDAVGLLDARDTDAVRVGDLAHRHEVARFDSPARAVTKD
jgi:hypothetical protein